MQIAGQEIKYKRCVLKDQKRALRLCDTIRQGLVDYLIDEMDDKLTPLASDWKEFSEVALESPNLPVDALASEEVLQILMGFTQRASTTNT